jgi:hypothetical protein
MPQARDTFTPPRAYETGMINAHYSSFLGPSL